MEVVPSRGTLQKAVDELRDDLRKSKERIEDLQKELEDCREGLLRNEATDLSIIAEPYFERTIPNPSGPNLIIDPVYGSIRIEPKLSRLIKHGTLVRLDYLRQLPFVAVENANATHTRQAHSLGVARFCEMAIQEMLNRDKIFVKNSDKIENFDLEHSDKEEFVFLAKVCGLLHDIGHAPFGHSLDRLVPIKIKEAQKGGQHPDKYFSALYVKEYLSDALQEIGIDPDTVISILCPAFGANPEEKPYTKYLSILKIVVDSDLDVDRMDFLIRDSMSSGLPFAFVNATALIDGMRPVTTEEEGRKIYTLAYDEGVASHVEHATYGRHAMYDHCYETDTRIACETMLIYCVRDFLHQSSLEMKDLIKYADDELLNHIIKYARRDTTAFNVAVELKMRRVYDTVFSQATDPKLRGGICEVVDDYIKARIEERYDDPIAPIEDWRNKITDGVLSREGEEWKTLVYLTPPDRFEQSGIVNVYILLGKSGNKVARISDHKPRIGQIVRDYTKSMPRLRVFVSPSLDENKVGLIRNNCERFFRIG